MLEKSIANRSTCRYIKFFIPFFTFQ